MKDCHLILKYDESDHCHRLLEQIQDKKERYELSLAVDFRYDQVLTGIRLKITTKETSSC